MIASPVEGRLLPPEGWRRLFVDVLALLLTENLACSVQQHADGSNLRLFDTTGLTFHIRIAQEKGCVVIRAGFLL